MPADDNELIRLIREGDSDAENALIKRYADYVEVIARPYFIVGAEHEDIVQIGLIGLMRAIRTYDENSSANTFKTYAAHCIRNAILDGVRESNALKHSPLNEYSSIAPSDDGDDDGLSLPSGELNPEEQMIVKEAEEAFFDALGAAFNETDLNIIKLYLACLPYKEISNTLGVTAKKVDNTIYNAKKKIQKLIAQVKDEFPDGQ